MKTPICPTCGCSLVRLGIGRNEAVPYSHESQEYYFCCEGCLEQFLTDPEQHLRDTAGLIVCPVCLTEKPLNLATKLEHKGQDYDLCRCPHCRDEFVKNPAYYIERLGGEDYPGIFKAACCPD